MSLRTPVFRCDEEKGEVYSTDREIREVRPRPVQCHPKEVA